MGAVKVVNKATGEVIQLPYDSFEDFAMQYDDVTQQIAALERAKKKMSTELKLMMGDERELPLANGWHFAKYTSTRSGRDGELPGKPGHGPARGRCDPVPQSGEGQAGY
jgi:hypothetical protein